MGVLLQCVKQAGCFFFLAPCRGWKRRLRLPRPLGAKEDEAYSSSSCSVSNRVGVFFWLPAGAGSVGLVFLGP